MVFFAVILVLLGVGCGAAPQSGIGLDGTEWDAEAAQACEQHPENHWEIPVWRALQADVNGDSRPDLICVWLPGEFGTVEVTVDAARWASVPLPLWGLRAGDIDGDGDVDLLVGIESRRHPGTRTITTMGWHRAGMRDLYRASSFGERVLAMRVCRASDGLDHLLLAQQRGTEVRWIGFVWQQFGYIGSRSIGVREDGSCIERVENE